MLINNFKLWLFFEKCSYAVAMLGFIAIFRILQISDPVHGVLFFSIAYNLLFCFLGLFAFKQIKFNMPILLLAFCFFYPILIGLFNENINITYLMDCLVYGTFIMKLVIFHQFFKQEWFHKRVAKFLLNFSMISAVVCLISASMLILLLYLNRHFYYSLTPEVTYGLSAAIVSGNIKQMILFFAVGLLSGKRMLIIGLLVIFLVAYKKYLSSFKNNIMILLFIIMFLILSAYHFAPLTKVTMLFSYDFGSKNIFNILNMIDHHRYDEVQTLLRSMNDVDFLFGKGYGFRYQYAGYESVSNSHFTPVGLISKFGIIGFILFYSIFIWATLKAFIYRKYEPQMYIIFLCLISYLLQANFAYILFHTPIFVIVLSYSLSYKPFHVNKLASHSLASA